MNMQKVIKRLNLQPIWEGGYLSQFYSSTEVIPKGSLSKEFDGDRLLFTWAYYLLPEGCKCPFHLMYADESWQFCSGGPLELYMISPLGETSKVVIGNKLSKGHEFIYIVPKGYWFAAKPQKGSHFTLITHLVSPGFAHQDWQKGYYNDLVKRFPHARSLIKSLAWPDES